MASNSTRAIWAGGFNPSTDIMDYMTIATLGNATFFGNLTQAASAKGQLANTTRMLMAGDQGVSPNFLRINVIEYVEISTLGNGQDFGDLTDITHNPAGCSSSTRGLFGGGSTPAGIINRIDYVTISTFGNAVDFGDLTLERTSPRATSNSIRGIFIGGYKSPSSLKMIDYVTISSTGNAADFGDTVANEYLTAATSDSHGGI